MPNSQQAISPEVINTVPYLTIDDRNKAIIAERILYNAQGVELAQKYKLSTGMISRIILHSERDENIRAYVSRFWEKRVIDKARSQVLAILDSINPKKIPEGQKATSIGILIDKVRLLQGQATEISEVRVLDMAAMLKALR